MLRRSRTALSTLRLRDREALAYPAEVKGDMVQFSEVISDDEMIRLTRAVR